MRADIDAAGWRRPLLVHGKRSFLASGASDAILPQLLLCDVGVFDDVVTNPTTVAVAQCMAAIVAHRADVVIAVGGGSALDTAKAAVWGLARGGDLDAALDRDPGQRSPALPLVAVPTTAGTGSEVTHFAAIYRDGVKFSVAGAELRPTLAYCDPALTQSLPRATTVAAGLDSFCQAVESLWSVGSTAHSRGHARIGAQLALRHLLPAATHGGIGDRAGMMEAATRAGLGIDVSKTTACHALSYTLTSSFGVDHGLAVAVFLPPVLRFNAAVDENDCLDPRGLAAARAVIAEICDLVGATATATDPGDGGAVTTLAGRAEQAASRLEAWMAALGVSLRLADYGVATRAERAFVAASVNAERLGNNPRRLDAASLRALVESIA